MFVRNHSGAATDSFRCTVHDTASEAQLQAAVIELAARTGWRVFHAKTMQTNKGRWLTAQAGHNGFPDLVLVHRTKGILFVELKSKKGRLSPDQVEWGQMLEQHGEWRLWRPADWPTIVKTLT